MSVSSSEINNTLRAAFNPTFFENLNTRAKKKETDFYGDWDFVETEDDVFYLANMENVVYENNILSFRYKTVESAINEEAVAEVERVKAEWESKGWQVADRLYHALENPHSYFSDDREVITEHRIENPKFYYYDETDREPIVLFKNV